MQLRSFINPINFTLFKQVTQVRFPSIMQSCRSSSSTIKESKITVKGQTINYVRAGQGEKTLLCFPGALGTIWSDFKPQILNLDSDKFTIIAWDPPGYGFSRPPEREFSLQFYENDANIAYDFMKELGIREYSLLGWSDGGISSLILSSKYPTVVKNLVIWGANSYVTPEEIELYEKIRDISQWSDKMKAPLIELYTEPGLQSMWNGWCDTLKQISANGGDICKECLSHIQCPTLILHGDQDPMVLPEHPDYLHAKIKNSIVHRFPKGKHNIHLRYAEEFNNIITNFLLK